VPNHILPLEIVISRLSGRGITLTGEYSGTKIKTKFECEYGHEWTATPKNIMAGYGCPCCGGTVPLTKEIVAERISTRGLTMIDEYINVNTKSLFCCSLDHKWIANINLVLRGHGCPTCAKSGLDPTKPTHGYVLIFETFIKYGISTNLPSRLSRHKTNNGSFVLHKTKLFKTGFDAISWEKNIKKTLGGKYVNKKLCPDGWTETLSLEKLSEIEKLI